MGNKTYKPNGLSFENFNKGVPDWRYAYNSSSIPVRYYADQPYVVKTDDGAWLCSVTTGEGEEGASGQHVVTMRSTDQGKTWADLAAVEPPDGLESSYSVLLKAPGGRIYIFYNHNTDNVRKVKADISEWSPNGYFNRVDSLGYFVFKYSDDHGKSWSQKRYPIPVREFECDRVNADGGKLRYFWNVGKPFVRGGAAFVSLHKVGRMGQGFFAQSEGALLKSTNLLAECDPDKIIWETLPDGDVGLQTPPGGGPISEEQSYSVLDDGSFYCVYRSIDGHPVFTYSRDGGHTWSVPQYKRYADGRLMKHPRAANFAWKCSNGKYLYWFHNHGGTWYDDRNPVWVCGGIEKDSPDGRVIAWTQPEILLYEDDTYVRMSYPDMIEDEGKLYITETNKNKARIREIDPEFLDRLWSQFEISRVEEEGLLLHEAAENGTLKRVDMPQLPKFTERDVHRPDYGTKDLRSGITLEFRVSLSGQEKGILLLDSRTADGMGICVETGENGTIGIILNDGRTENRWYCEPGMLEAGKLHHVGIVVDGGPKIISFVIDGKFCDGGASKQFGWGRFSRDLYHVNGTKTAKLASGGKAEVKMLRIYGRALMTTELIGNYRAGI